MFWFIALATYHGGNKSRDVKEGRKKEKQEGFSKNETEQYNQSNLLHLRNKKKEKAVSGHSHSACINK